MVASGWVLASSFTVHESGSSPVGLRELPTPLLMDRQVEGPLPLPYTIVDEMQ